MSLLQSPRRPSSDVLALASTGRALDPDLAFPGSDGLRDEARVDLARELDLSSERPHASAPAGRGPGLLVASIVASSLVLAGIIMMVRGDAAPKPDEPAAVAPISEVVSASAPIPVEPTPTAAAPAEPPARVASQSVPAAKKPPASAEITPAAIAPTSPSRSILSMIPVTVLFCARIRSDSDDSERSWNVSRSLSTVSCGPVSPTSRAMPFVSRRDSV